MRAVFALSLVAALAGCSTMEKMNPVNWFSSAPKVKPAELEAISSSATLATLWQASVGSAGGYVLTPAVVGSSVYAAAQDGTLARFDNGGQAWRINAGQPISGGVGADGRLVVVTADQHTGYGVNQCSEDVVDLYLIDPVANAPADGTVCD